MMRTLRLLLVLVMLLAGVASSAGAESPPGGPGCGPGLALLVDRSASMVDHDPHGELRIAVAEGLRPAGASDAAAGFDSHLESPRPVGAGGWPAAVAQVMAGGDHGPTELGRVLAESGSLAPRRLVVVTDTEAVLDGAVAAAPAIEAVIVLGGRPGPGVAEGVRERGGHVVAVRTVAEAASAGRSICAGGAHEAVLVAGLRERTAEVRGASTDEDCLRAGPLAAWCGAFVGHGWRVWVPATAPGGGPGVVVDSTGSLEGNGAVFARWLRHGPGRGVVLVGHSMGGLVAHAALARGARAAGLITVGTPHAGSYGADAYFAAIAAARGCLVLCPSVAATLTGAAIVLRHRFGAALADLTRDRRTRTAPLGPPGVPLAAWAGAVNGQPVLPPGLPLAGRIRDDYLVPNDGIVGRGSATGALADLRPAAVVRDGAARHSSAVPPRSAPTELGAPAVAAWVVGAAEGFAAEPQAARLAAPRRSVPRSATVELQSLARLQPGGEAQPITDRAVVISTAPIGVLCDDVPAAPVEVTPGLWFLDLGAMGCRTVRRSGTPVKRAGAAIALGIDGGAVPVGERATAVRSSRGGWRLVVRLTAPGRPSVTRAGRAIRLRRLRGTTEWRAGRSWAALLPRPGVRSVAIRVGVEGPSPRVAALALP